MEAKYLKICKGGIACVFMRDKFKLVLERRELIIGASCIIASQELENPIKKRGSSSLFRQNVLALSVSLR